MSSTPEAKHLYAVVPPCFFALLKPRSSPLSSGADIITAVTRKHLPVVPDAPIHRSRLSSALMSVTMEQRISLPPFLNVGARTAPTWRSNAECGGKMSSGGGGSGGGSPGSLQLPPLSEVLKGVDQGRHPEDARGPYDQKTTSSGQHAFPEAQSLAPSPGRLRPSFASPSMYPSESSVSSEYSDRRNSNWASPSSSTSVTSAKESPILPPMHPMQPPHRAPAPDFSSGRGLPPLYGAEPARGPPSPGRHPHPPYPSPYVSAQGQEYVGPYSRGPQGHGGPPPASAYPAMGYDGMGDYGDGKQKRRRGNLPKAVTDILRQWFQDHIAHPYPTEEEKQTLMHQTGLTMSQISNWFINARRRSLPQMHNRQGPGD